MSSKSINFNQELAPVTCFPPPYCCGVCTQADIFPLYKIMLHPIHHTIEELSAKYGEDCPAASFVLYSTNEYPNANELSWVINYKL